MTTFKRPGPDIDKVHQAWRAWTNGDEPLPGRTLADLKIAGVDAIVEQLVADGLRPELAEAWRLWERGKVGPAESLVALTGHGFADLVEALVRP